MCGLVGFSGKSPDLNALKILGIYNDTRGGDACGFAINNKIFKSSSVDLDRFSKMFTKKEGQERFINKNNKDQIVLMHTRKGSAGGRTSEQAHPYKVINSNGRELIGIHNGTIRNIDDLVDKYLKDTDIVFKHSDTDSLKLYTILCETQKLDVLTEYEGGAALLWYYTDEPTTLYAFKGASESAYYNYSTYSSIEEERPLFYGIINDSIYFSSIKDSLFSINVQTVFSVDNNTVKTIKSGKIVETVDIKRVSPYYKKVESKKSNLSLNNSSDSMTNFYTRTEMQEASTDLVTLKRKTESGFYLDELLYLQNGHPMSGVYYLHFDYDKGYISACEVESISKMNLSSLNSYAKQCTLGTFIDAYKEYRETKKQDIELHSGTYAVFFSGMLIDTDKILDPSKYIVQSFRKGLAVLNRLKTTNPFYWLDRIDGIKDIDNLEDLKTLSEITINPIVINSNISYYRGILVSKTYNFHLIPEVKVEMSGTTIVKVTDSQIETEINIFSTDKNSNSKISEFKLGSSVLLNIKNCFKNDDFNNEWLSCTVYSINFNTGVVSVKFNKPLKLKRGTLNFFTVTDLDNLVMVEEESFSLGDIIYYFDSRTEKFEKAKVCSLSSTTSKIGIKYSSDKVNLTFFVDKDEVLTELDYADYLEDNMNSEIEIGMKVYSVSTYDTLEILSILNSNRGEFRYKVLNKRTNGITHIKRSEFILEPIGNSSKKTDLKEGDIVYTKHTKLKYIVNHVFKHNEINVWRNTKDGTEYTTFFRNDLITEKEYIEDNFEPNSEYKSDWFGIFNTDTLRNFVKPKEISSEQLVNEFKNKKINIEKMEKLINKLEKNKNAINSLLSEYREEELPQSLIDKMEGVSTLVAKLEEFVVVGKDILNKSKELTNV